MAIAHAGLSDTKGYRERGGAGEHSTALREDLSLSLSLSLSHFLKTERDSIPSIGIVVVQALSSSTYLGAAVGWEARVHYNVVLRAVFPCPLEVQEEPNQQRPSQHCTRQQEERGDEE